MNESVSLTSNTNPKNIQGRQSSRGRILPSSTADVQAAIAAIQARSAALRKQQQNAMSSNNQSDSRTDILCERSPGGRRDSISGSTIDSDDANEDYFANIGNMIDGVNGMEKGIGDEDSLSSSDSDDSSDISLEANVEVSKATKLNIGAFIDSLNAAAKMPLGDNQIESDNIDDNCVEDVEMNANNDNRAIESDGHIFNDAEEVQMVASKISIQYDELKLDEYIDKAGDVVSRSRAAGRSLEFGDVENVVFYAWKNKVPIIPLIDAFDDAMQGSAEYIAMRFTHFVRKAVDIVEEVKFDNRKADDLLKEARTKKVDVSFLKVIFKNPEKHIVYRDAVGAHIENLNDKENAMQSLGSRKQRTDVEHEAGKGVDTQRIYFQKKMQQLTISQRHYFHGMREPTGIPSIGSVDASKKVLSKKVFKLHPCVTPFKVVHWKIPKTERSEGHLGYNGVHAKSLTRVAVQAGIKHTLETFEWEKLGSELTRKRGLADTVNWLGKSNFASFKFSLIYQSSYASCLLRRICIIELGNFEQTRQNRRMNEAITQPDTVVFKRLMYPKPWEEEWFTTWLSRKHNHGGQTRDKQRYRPMYSDGSVRPTSRSSMRSSRTGMIGNGEEEQDTSIGKLHTMRYRAGERMSRVHYDYTSFLFKSKWKRKYFPKGIFSNS